MGEALYVDAAALDHSCAPSVERWTYGRILQCRAMRRIDTSIEAPLVYYIDVAYPRDVRRHQLKLGWFFDCQCSKCSTVDDHDFDYRLYRTWRETLNHTNVDLDLKQRLVKMHEFVYGDHNQFKTLTMAHLLINRLQSPPKNRCDHKSWFNQIKQLESSLDREFKVTHGKDHPMYRIYMIDVRLKLYKQLKSKLNIDFKRLQ